MPAAIPAGLFAALLALLVLWLGGMAWLWRRGWRVWAGFGAFLALGVVLGVRATRPARFAPGVAAALESGAPVPASGVWLRTLRYAAGEVGARGLLDADAVAGTAVDLRVALTFRPGRAPPLPGDRVTLTARLAEPWGLRNPGLPDPAWGLRAQGIELVGIVAAEGPGGRTPGSWWGPRRLAERAHAAMARAIDAAVPTGRGALVKALVLGERAAAGGEVEAGFKAAGAVHALSVSGLHLTAIAGALFLILQRGLLLLPGLALRARPAVVAALLAVPAILFYCAITGEATATRRAAVMAALGMAAVVVGRLPSLAAALGASAIALLADQPLLLYDASFQLSFSSVLALSLISGRWRGARAAGTAWPKRAAIWIGRALLVSTAAFLATAPLAAHHFGELAPASPLGNLALVPPVELGIVPLGLLGAALGALWRPLGWVPLQLADLLCRLALAVAEGFRRFAPVLPVPSPDGVETLALFAAALLLLVGFAHPGRGRRRYLAGAALAAALGGGGLGLRALRQRTRDDVQITFLDVGQGDAALIEGPRGFVALIDGGGAIDGSFDPGARVIEPVLRRKTIMHVDLVVLSHPHPDHMNGLVRVLERFPVGAFWSSSDRGGDPADAAYDRLVGLARARGVRVETPRALTANGLGFEPLGPWVGDVIAAPEGLSANDGSLVLRLDFAGRRVLFTGDIEAEGEAELLARTAPAELVCDLLKVPHHGSRTSSGAALLAAVRPAVAIASLGRHNRFGFPRPEVVARYETAGIRLLRTDWSGAVVMAITRTGVLRTTCSRSCR